MSDEQTRAADADTREARIGQVLDEFLNRRSRGERPSAAELLAEHPDLADDLRAHLELLEDLRPGGGKIEDLIAQGILTRSDDPRYAGKLGAYSITDFIGRGGMGIVLKAYEESLNRTVALKILRPDLASDQAVLTRFEREAKAAAALRHPNIVTVYAVGHERGVHFIAMEYVDGPSLADVIRGIDPRRHKDTKGDVASGLRTGRPTAKMPVPQEDVASGLRTGRPTAKMPVPQEDVAAGLRTGRADRSETGPPENAVAAPPTRYSPLATRYSTAAIRVGLYDLAITLLRLGDMDVTKFGQALRFCPAYPQVLPEMAESEDFINQSQRMFFAIDLHHVRWPGNASKSASRVRPRTHA